MLPNYATKPMTEAEIDAAIRDIRAQTTQLERESKKARRGLEDAMKTLRKMMFRADAEIKNIDQQARRDVEAAVIDYLR